MKYRFKWLHFFCKLFLNDTQFASFNIIDIRTLDLVGICCQTLGEPKCYSCVSQNVTLCLTTLLQFPAFFWVFSAITPIWDLILFGQSHLDRPIRTSDQPISLPCTSWFFGGYVLSWRLFIKRWQCMEWLCTVSEE